MKQQPNIERLSRVFIRTLKAWEKNEEECKEDNEASLEFWESPEGEAAHLRNEVQDRLLKLARQMSYDVKCECSLDIHVEVSIDTYNIEVVFPDIKLFDFNAAEKILKDWLKREGLLSEYDIEWCWFFKNGDLILDICIGWIEGDYADPRSFL